MRDSFYSIQCVRWILVNDLDSKQEQTSICAGIYKCVVVPSGLRVPHIYRDIYIPSDYPTMPIDHT